MTLPPSTPSPRPRERTRAMGAVDWVQLHARIEDAMRTVAGQAEPAEDEVRAILRERARVLARRPETRADRDMREYLDVGAGRERLLVDSRCVIEVLRRVNPTPLPGAQAPVAALVAWRGRILTALDLRLLIAAPANGGDGAQPLVVLGGERPELGLLVEHVGDLEEIALASIRPPPEHLRHGYASGISNDARSVLDVALLLQRHANVT